MQHVLNGPQLLGVLGFLLWSFVPAAAQPRLADPARKIEEVGSWAVDCTQEQKPGPPACDIRHRVWIVAPAGGRPSAALEIQMRHGFAVPVVAIHGAAHGGTIPDATGALLALAAEVTVQFGADPPIRLPCGFARDILGCAPARADAQAASVRLGRAATAVIRLHLAAPAGLALPVSDQLRVLDLTRTTDAIRRLLPAGNPPEEADTRWDLHDLMDWVARQLGFAGGLEELLRWLFSQAAVLQKG